MTGVQACALPICNLSRPNGPTLTIGVNQYDPMQIYSQGEEIHFNHNDLSDPNYIYFTTNGETPNSSSSFKYDKENPRKLDFGTNSTLEISAIFYDNVRGVESSVTRFVVSRKSAVGSPVASIRNNSNVKPGQVLYLHLGDIVASQIGAIHGVSVKYGDAYDPENDPYKDGYELAEGSGQPIEGIKYLIIESSPDNTKRLPTIKYLLNDSTGDLKENGRMKEELCLSTA